VDAISAHMPDEEMGAPSDAGGGPSYITDDSIPF
jgi:hypothetical protein